MSRTVTVYQDRFPDARLRAIQRHLNANALRLEMRTSLDAPTGVSWILVACFYPETEPERAIGWGGTTAEMLDNAEHHIKQALLVAQFPPVEETAVSP